MKRVLCIAAICGLLVTVAYADVDLVDGSGLEYQIYTDTDTSGAAEEASYTTSVTATTTYGATTTVTLSDAFDTYCALAVNGTLYGDNGVATLEDNGREIVMNPQQIGNLLVQRKVFVPDDDEFCRWLTIITNTGPRAVQEIAQKAFEAEEVLVNFYGDMGSDSSTAVFYTSLADKGATPSRHDTWVVTGGDYGDPRLGHVFQGPEAQVKPFFLALQEEDSWFWRYRFWLNPGETIILMHFVTGQPDVEDARAQAIRLEALQGAALAAMTEEEKGQVINFLIHGTPTIQCAATKAAKDAPISEALGDMAVLGSALLVSFALGRRRRK